MDKYSQILTVAVGMEWIYLLILLVARSFYSHI